MCQHNRNCKMLSRKGSVIGFIAILVLWAIVGAMAALTF